MAMSSMPLLPLLLVRPRLRRGRLGRRAKSRGLYQDVEGAAGVAGVVAAAVALAPEPPAVTLASEAALPQAAAPALAAVQ